MNAEIDNRITETYDEDKGCGAGESRSLLSEIKEPGKE